MRRALAAAATLAAIVYRKRSRPQSHHQQQSAADGKVAHEHRELIGALMVHPEDEVYAITSAGGVIRTAAAQIKLSGRQTMGVRLVNLASGQSLVAIARNAEAIEAGNGADADGGVEPEDDTSGTDEPDIMDADSIEVGTIDTDGE